MRVDAELPVDRRFQVRLPGARLPNLLIHGLAGLHVDRPVQGGFVVQSAFSRQASDGGGYRGDECGKEDYYRQPRQSKRSARPARRIRAHGPRNQACPRPSRRPPRLSGEPRLSGGRAPWNSTEVPWNHTEADGFSTPLDRRDTEEYRPGRRGQQHSSRLQYRTA